MPSTLSQFFDHQTHMSLQVPSFSIPVFCILIVCCLASSRLGVKRIEYRARRSQRGLRIVVICVNGVVDGDVRMMKALQATEPRCSFDVEARSPSPPKLIPCAKTATHFLNFGPRGLTFPCFRLSVPTPNQHSINDPLGHNHRNSTPSRTLIDYYSACTISYSFGITKAAAINNIGKQTSAPRPRLALEPTTLLG
jgi:hypothetical protein